MGKEEKNRKDVYDWSEESEGASSDKEKEPADISGEESKGGKDSKDSKDSKGGKDGKDSSGGNDADSECTSCDELEKALSAAKAANEKYLRLFAEFDNYRKRTTKEKTESYNDATVKCIEQILPVLDSFNLALQSPCQDENFLKGMQMILNQFTSILEKMNVKEIDALGAKFDPTIHNAIKQIEDIEKEPDTVCEVFQKGYMLGDKLIRASVVAVVS